SDQPKDILDTLVDHWKQTQARRIHASFTVPFDVRPGTISGVGDLVAQPAEFSGHGNVTLPPSPNLLMQAGIVVFGDRTNEGQLIQAVSLPWFEIIRELERDPRFLFALPWRKLQELVAGAYDRAGFPGSRGYKEEARLIEALPGRLRPLVVVALNTGM